MDSPSYHDDRGDFRQLYNIAVTEALGLTSFKQVNFSLSKKNVFRGFHVQLPPWGQGKLIHCLSGSIIDCILDPDPSSETFGEISQITLSSKSGQSIWIPARYAHGFLSLEEDTRVAYAVSMPWMKEKERSINPLSTNLFDSFDFSKVLLSEKDRFAPSLSEIANSLASEA